MYSAMSEKERACRSRAEFLEPWLDRGDPALGTHQDATRLLWVHLFKPVEALYALSVLQVADEGRQRVGGDDPDGTRLDGLRDLLKPPFLILRIDKHRIFAPGLTVSVVSALSRRFSDYGYFSWTGS